MTQTSALTLDERIARLETLLTIPVPGTQITRVMREDHGFRWCVAIGVMNMAKNFYYGDTVEDAVGAAEADLLTPKVPDEANLRHLAKNPKQPLMNGLHIRAVVDMSGIDLKDYAPKPRTRKATAAA